MYLDVRELTLVHQSLQIALQLDVEAGSLLYQFGVFCKKKRQNHSIRATPAQLFTIFSGGDSQMTVSYQAVLPEMAINLPSIYLTKGSGNVELHRAFYVT